MLQPFGPDIWIADGPIVTAAAGFRYPTRMVVIRLQDGRLVIVSPVALSSDLSAELNTLGPVATLVPPNDLHDTFLGDWVGAFPTAAVFAPPGLRAKRKDIAFDLDLGDTPPPAWGDEIETVVVRGNRITSEVVFFHRQSRTAIFTDLLQRLPRDWFTGWRAIVARLDLMTASEPATPRKFRLAFTDRRAAWVAVQRILAWPTIKVLIAHGAPITEDGQAFLRRAFRWLGT